MPHTFHKHPEKVSQIKIVKHHDQSDAAGLAGVLCHLKNNARTKQKTAIISTSY